MTDREAEAAARVLERLLADPGFREYFRRNPVAASREEGLESLAQEMATSSGKAMETLDDRESRSSLAGVFMAAALEGAGVWDFSKDLVPHLNGIPEQVEDVLSRVHQHGGVTTPAGLADVGVPGAVTPLVEQPPAPPNAAGEFPAITPEQVAGAQDDPAAPDDPAPADDPAPPDGGDDEDEEEEDEDDASDGEQRDADDGPGGDGSTGGGDDGDHDDTSDGAPASGGEGSGGGDGETGASVGDSGDGGHDPQLGVDDSGDAGQVDVGDVADGYPGDTAARADIATWMASEAQKRGLPPELPVMAALTESDLHNLKYGDADSLGYFQMRAGTWNQGEYAGYSDHVELQLKWFLDQADAVKRQRVAAGKPVDDANGYGDWIADIERPKAEYRGRYQLHLDDARGLLRKSDGGGDDRGGGKAELQVEPAVDDDGAAGTRAMAALAEARKQLGTPYQWGGSSPSTGFDCSGLVQWAYAKVGIEIPRTSEQQILASNGKAVDREHLKPGDLVFFRDAGGDVHHVGISLGGDKFLNAPHTGAKVRIDDLDQPYYAREFAGGRRFDSSGGGSAQTVEAGQGSGIDPDAVQKAEASLARDAAEAQRPGTLMFEAVRAQELRKEFHTQTLGAVEPQPAG
jgi:cell wall-associated NlpC family hydrolase